MDLIYITLPMASQPRILNLLNQLRDTTASIYFVPDIFMFDLIQARVDTLTGIPVVAVCETPFYGLNGVIKTISDFVIAILALIITGPLMLAIAVAIKLDSPGPVLFRQRRYGLDGREITVYKFRTMTVLEDGGEVRQATKDDKRITRIGRLPPQDLDGRTAAVHQRAAGPDERSWPAPARGGPQRDLSQADRRLHGQAQGQAGRHRLGAGQRLPRRDRHASRKCSSGSSTTLPTCATGRCGWT